jgi:GntR family transcriptional regulator
VLESIETISKRLDLPVSMGEKTITFISADDELALMFDMPVRTPLVKVERVINVEDRPVAFLIDIVVNDILLPVDLQKGFTGSVLDFLIRRGNPTLSHSVAEIQAVAASSDIARYLEIQRGDPLIQLSAKLYSDEGRMIDASSSYFLPGVFRFQVVRRVGSL